MEPQGQEECRQLLADVAHHSRLEDQSVSDADLAIQIEEIASELIDRRGLWRDTEA